MPGRWVIWGLPMKLFSTMKFIFFAGKPKNLVVQGFCKKERKLQRRFSLLLFCLKVVEKGTIIWYNIIGIVYVPQINCFWRRRCILQLECLFPLLLGAVLIYKNRPSHFVGLFILGEVTIIRYSILLPSIIWN